MESIRIRNLRSIVDSKEFKINKINILLGKNSSGKSSLLRIFPMFAESAKHELRAPLMWVSDDFDFGSFKNALNNKVSANNNSNIEFEFTWDLTQNNKKKDFFPFLKNSQYLNVSLSIGQSDKSTFLRQLAIKATGVNLRLECTSPKSFVKFYLDDQPVDLGKAQWQYDYRGVFPNLRLQTEKNEYLTRFLNLQNRYNEYNSGKGIDVLLSSPLDSLTIEGVKEQIRTKLANQLKDSSNENNTIELVMSALLPPAIYSLLSYCDQYLSYYFARVHYIAPLRYHRQRYSIENQFAVNRVDTSGKNLVDFIASLEEKQVDSLNVFLKSTLKASLDIQGDVSKEIRIINEDESYNIVDLGYGYTQLLPIAVTLWEVTQTKSETEHTIVVEQPEVHLHPSLQSELAHLFLHTIEEAKKNKVEIKLLIETHSAYLVNRLGLYIYNTNHPYANDLPKHKVNADEITIYLFDKENGETQIQPTSYDDKGRVKEWPIGFLD